MHDVCGRDSAGDHFKAYGICEGRYVCLMISMINMQNLRYICGIQFSEKGRDFLR